MLFRVPAAAALLLLLSPAVAGEEAIPRAIVENPKLDLGRVVRGQTAEGVFRVRNLGAAPLHIKGAKPG
jgi:hypothetical protein